MKYIKRLHEHAGKKINTENLNAFIDIILKDLDLSGKDDLEIILNISSSKLGIPENDLEVNRISDRPEEFKMSGTMDLDFFGIMQDSVLSWGTYPGYKGEPIAIFQVKDNYFQISKRR